MPIILASGRASFSLNEENLAVVVKRPHVAIARRPEAVRRAAGR